MQSSIPHSNNAGKEYQMANLPPAKFRIGNVTATVWLNERHYNTVLSKSYKDDQGEWKDTDQLGHGDLLNAMKCLERAEDYISDHV